MNFWTAFFGSLTAIGLVLALRAFAIGIIRQLNDNMPARQWPRKNVRP